MLYRLYAIKRVTSDKIMIMEFSDIKLMEQIVNYFDSSENILRFIITSLDEKQQENIVLTKELDYDIGKTLSLHK